MVGKKRTHEIRDPIHTFIKVDNREREIIDSRPFQRLRNIHQLALSHLVYPGATHRRFEHSLGVMDLAGRVFDVVTNEENIRFESVEAILPTRVISLIGDARCEWQLSVTISGTFLIPTRQRRNCFQTTKIMKT
jgi:HD superfamily phosphohydrolase